MDTLNGTGAVKGSGKTKRKRHASVPGDPPAVGHFRTRDQTEQSRFTGAVDSEDAEITPRRENGRDIVEHDLATSRRRIGFGNLFKADHGGSLNFRRNALWTASPASTATVAARTRYGRSSQFGW